MSDKYKIRDIQKAHFVTLTVVGWIDVFTRRNHKLQIINSLKYCQQHKDGNQAKEIYGNQFLEEKLNYIHNNPVEEMIVSKPEEYLFSSARNYAGLDSMIDVFLISRQWKTYA
jgi:predicted ATP-dependent Lon-type protease